MDYVWRPRDGVIMGWRRLRSGLIVGGGSETAYRFWLVRTTVRPTGWVEWTNIMGVNGGVDAWTNNMTSNTAPSPKVASASSIISTAYDAHDAFDGLATRWGTNVSDAGPWWIKLDLGSGNEVVCDQIKLTPYNGYYSTDFTVRAANTDHADHDDWDTLLTVTGKTDWVANTEETFDLN